jgi:hypothetical protein
MAAHRRMADARQYPGRSSSPLRRKFGQFYRHPDVDNAVRKTTTRKS